VLNPDYRDMLSAFADAEGECLIIGAYASLEPKSRAAQNCGVDLLLSLNVRAFSPILQSE